MTVSILVGDARERLAEMPNESVHCVVTSPPYYGLRDYGTAVWDGGDAGCDHKQGRPGAGRADGIVDERAQRNRDSVGSMGGDCNRCGARRIDRQIGLEPSPAEYVETLVAVFREVRRVLRKDGTLWLNLGDSYAGGVGFTGRNDTDRETPGGRGGSFRGGERTATTQRSGLKPKDLIGIPWLVAFALRADGWWLRQDIIWSKPNPMPESVTDRCTKAHEYVFLLSKSERYWFDAAAIAEEALQPEGIERKTGQRKKDRLRETGIRNGNGTSTSILGSNQGSAFRNKRSVWTVATQPFSEWGETVRQVRVEPDALVDGKKRKASPDCPVHADQADPVPKASYGGRVAGQSRRNTHSDVDRGPTLPLDCGSIETHHEPGIAQQSSGSVGLACSPSATPHSIEIRRTALAPETNPACTVSAQTLGRIGGIEGERELYGSAERMRESNTSADDPPVDPSAQKPRRTERITSAGPVRCTCEWYVEIIDNTSHFATFPPALVEPCILAGSPRGGTVLDPFIGAGTTGIVADRLGRDCIGIELNPAYAEMARRRIADDAGMFSQITVQEAVHD